MTHAPGQVLYIQGQGHLKEVCHSVEYTAMEGGRGGRTQYLHLDIPF